MCYKNEIDIVTITADNQDAVVVEAVRALKVGKVIACPTDTIYGLMVDATNEKAVLKVFNIKKRSVKKVFPLFIKDIKAAEKLAEINQQQKVFLKKYWPGKVTVVLKRKGRQKLFGVDKQTIGLRMPNHKLFQAILAGLGRPVVQTSANISGELPINNPKKIIKEFAYKKYAPDMVLDAGPIKNGVQSTIVDLTGEDIKILRKGAIKL